MRRLYPWQKMALALSALALVSGCILIPEIVKKIVELALSGSTTVDFVAVGILNTHDARKTIDVEKDLNLLKVLDDAGIRVADLKDIKLLSVSYRVTRPEAATPGREIQNGNVTIERGSGGGTETPLVSNFNVLVNAATTFQAALLDQAGVALVNALLQDILTKAKGGVPTNPDLRITYHVTGDSVPGNVPTDFDWQLKIEVSIVGTVTVDVPE